MRTYRMRWLIAALLVSTTASLVAVACGGSSEEPAEYPPAEDPGTSGTETTAVHDEPAGDDVEHATNTPPPPPPVQLVAGESSPLEGDAPALKILQPRNRQKIKRGDVMLKLQLRNWDLAPDPGNHVHVIVDNEDYIAVRDVAQPLNLNELVRTNLGHELAAGNHVVRVFPSRPTHESVKAASAFAAVSFEYQSPTEGFAFDPAAPLLTYSRPKGCNPAGQRILVDFFLTNVEALAADGFRVRYAIDSNTSGEITTWAPHYIENLQPGEHQIALTLVGADGAPAAGPFNDTTRTFSVQANCPPPPPPPAATPPAAGNTPPAGANSQGQGPGGAGAPGAGNNPAATGATPAAGNARGQGGGNAGGNGGAQGGGNPH